MLAAVLRGIDLTSELKQFLPCKCITGRFIHFLTFALSSINLTFLSFNFGYESTYRGSY